MKIVVTILLTCLGFVPLALSDTGVDETLSTIRIYIGNLRNDDGQIAALLFSSGDGFPGNETEAVMAMTSPIENGETVIEFTGVQHGEYAVSVIHDENMNESLNTNFLGIPTEGYWISNNERGGAFGGPDYDDAVFAVSTPTVVLIVSFDY